MLTVLYFMIALSSRPCQSCDTTLFSSYFQSQKSVRVMRAIRVSKFGPPSVLELKTDVPVPKIGPKEVLLKVKAAGVNPVETYIRAGQYARLPSLPFTPGGDAASIVRPANAEYAVVSSQSVFPLPSELSFAQGAALPVPYLTAYRALFLKGRARPGEMALVHGASGGVGVAAVQFARAYGMTVIGTAGTDEGLELVKKAGAHFTFNHRQTGYQDGIRTATSANRGIDLVIENAAHVNLGSDLNLLAPGGRVVVVGSRGSIEINPRDAMSREASVIGVMLFASTDAEIMESVKAINAGISNGWLRPIIGKEYPLDKASEAQRDIIEGPGALGKTVLMI